MKNWLGSVGVGCGVGPQLVHCDVIIGGGVTLGVAVGVGVGVKNFSGVGVGDFGVGV